MEFLSRCLKVAVVTAVTTTVVHYTLKVVVKLSEDKPSDQTNN